MRRSEHGVRPFRLHIYEHSSLQKGDDSTVQKFKITFFAFTVSCAVFMTLPVNARAQNDSNVQESVVDLEGAAFILQNLNEEMSDKIEEMSYTITELETKLAVIEYDLEMNIGKVEKTEDDLSALVDWTGTRILDTGSMGEWRAAIIKAQKEERQEELEQQRLDMVNRYGLMGGMDQLLKGLGAKSNRVDEDVASLKSEVEELCCGIGSKVDVRSINHLKMNH